MARSALRNRFTLFDMMDAKGVFSSNPANPDSVDPIEGTSLYTGPVEFPKMFYHPEAERRVLNPGEALRDGQGNPVLDRNGDQIIRGLQTEIIWQIASNASEAEKLRAAGWHDHPAKALAAAGQEAPAISSQQRIDEMEREMEKMRAELAAAKVQQLPTAPRRSASAE
jgi:hypothetical protein